MEILERDHYICRVRGPHCTVKADEVDHIVPTADGGDRWANENLRAACHWCNSWRASQTKSRDGWKRAHTRIFLVTGPEIEPLSAFVQDNAAPDDLVIDWTALVNAVGNNVDEVKKLRGSLLSRVRRGESQAVRAWITSCNPDAERMFPYHELVSWWPARTATVREW